MQTTIEALRVELHKHIDLACDAALAQSSPDAPPADVTYVKPSLADGHDSRNKNGLNLTPRGVEILYRVFDDDGGYNRAAKMLGISQGAAKNRKATWIKAGGKGRTKLLLDIDLI